MNGTFKWDSVPFCQHLGSISKSSHQKVPHKNPAVLLMQKVFTPAQPLPFLESFSRLDTSLYLIYRKVTYHFLEVASKYTWQKRSQVWTAEISKAMRVTKARAWHHQYFQYLTPAIAFLEYQHWFLKKRKLMALRKKTPTPKLWPLQQRYSVREI